MPPVPRTPPKLTAPQVVGGLIYHQLHCSGTLAKNTLDLHQIGMSESAFSYCRQGLSTGAARKILSARDSAATSSDVIETGSID